MNRRNFVQKSAWASTGIFLGFRNSIKAATSKSNPTIMLFSGWQTVNIGDIAHTPGMLTLLEKYFPQSKIIFWPKDINAEVEAMLRKNFPNVQMVLHSPIEMKVSNPEAFEAAVQEADFFLHGSGPGVFDLEKFTLLTQTGKPYGVYGVTVSNISEELKHVFNKAAFIYTRETASLKVLKNHGIECPVQDFGPDATFALQLANEPKALATLKNLKLSPQKFICIIPRLRRTPYYRIHHYVQWDAAQIKNVNESNAKQAAIDCAKLQYVITDWVNKTGLEVLLCPEMTYQLEMFPQIVSGLSEKVKKKVKTMPYYWITDEAASVYKRAIAVVSLECHSPIISYTLGVPAFYLRQPEDTIKGQMYYDLEAQDWTFEIDQTQPELIAERLLHVHANYQQAKNLAKTIHQNAWKRFEATMPTVVKSASIKR